MTIDLLLQIIKEKIQFYSETDDRVKWILEGILEEYEKRKLPDDNMGVFDGWNTVDIVHIFMKMMTMHWL